MGAGAVGKAGEGVVGYGVGAAVGLGRSGGEGVEGGGVGAAVGGVGKRRVGTPGDYGVSVAGVVGVRVGAAGRSPACTSSPFSAPSSHREGLGVSFSP